MNDAFVRRPSAKGLKTDWKQKLREVCLQRVRRERYQLLKKIRNFESTSGIPRSEKEHLVSTFGQIVSDELNKLNNSTYDTSGKTYDTSGKTILGADNALWEYEPNEASLPQTDFGNTYEELMIAMEKALYQDLEEELNYKEALLLEDYEKVQALEEISFVDLLEHAKHQQEGGLLCPICRKNYLHRERCLILCGCGKFQLNVQNDQIGLDYLRTRLAEVLQEHFDSQCQGQPQCLVNNNFGISALYMQCNTCGSFHLVM